MTSLLAFQYAVVRLVPREDRGEMINIGVILYCQDADYLECSVILEEARIAALAPNLELQAIREATDAIVRACQAAVGSQRENTGLAVRFGMLTAPKSTVVQPGPIHGGVTADPTTTLRQLTDRLVRSTSVGEAPTSGR